MQQNTQFANKLEEQDEMLEEVIHCLDELLEIGQNMNTTLKTQQEVLKHVTQKVSKEQED